MKFDYFSVGNFEVLRGIEGAFAPRVSVLWLDDEFGTASFMRFIRQTLSFENLFGERSSEERVSGCLVFRMDDGRALRAEPGGLLNFVTSADAKDTLGPAPEETKYLCLAAAAGLRTLSFPDFAARMDEKEKALDFLMEGSAAEGIPAEGERNILSRIRNNEAEIETLRAAKRNYKASLEVLEEKRNAVAWTEGQLKDERRRLRRLELVAQARPLWLEARDLEKALAALGPRRVKSRDGAARLDVLLEKAAALQKEADERRLKSSYEALRRKHIENSPSLSLLPYREALENLKEETNQIRQARLETLSLTEEMRDSERRLAGALSDFAPRWTEKDLLEADLSISSEERANAARDVLRAAEQRARDITLKLDEERASFAALEAEAASLRAETEKIETQRLETRRPKTDGAGPASLEERRDRLLEIRHGLLRNDILFWEIRAEKMRADTLEEELQAEEEPAGSGGSYIAKFLLALFLFFSGTAAALEYLTAILHPYGLVTALFSALIALLPLTLIFMDKKAHNRREQWWKARYLQRSETIGAINARIDEKKRKIQAVVTSIEQKSKDLGIRIPATADDLDEEFNRLTDEIVENRILEDRKDEERRVLQKIDASVRRKNQCSDDLTRAKQEAETALEDWRAWLTQNRFDASLSPEGFLSFLERMRAAREELRLLETLRDKLERRKEYASTLETKIRVLSGRVGLELSGENLPAIFRSLGEGLELKKQIEASIEAQNALDIERAAWEEELAGVLNDIRALCKESGVNDAAALRSLVEESARREALETRLNELRRILTGFLGSAGDDGGLKGRTAAAKSRKWAAYEAELLGDALKQAEELEELRITAAERESALEKLKAACDILERRTLSPFADERMNALERENAALRAQGQARSKNRLTFALAVHFAEKAAKRGAKERRKILRRAGQLFHPCLSLSETGADANNTRPGERERISLGLKLAAAYRRAERAEAIPLVLDDALARFGEDREQEIVQALWRTSERVQIVLLTARPSTARLLQDGLEREDGFGLLRV
jgi:uncharacterized protein YhaN